MSDLAQIKDHKEEVTDVLFSKDFVDTKDNGKEYPKNRLVVNKVKYSGKYLNKDKKYEDYSGEKVVIISTKLTLNNGNVEAKKKVVNNNIVDDRQYISLTIEQFEDLITGIS